MIVQVVVIASISAVLALSIVMLARRGLLSFRYTLGWLALLVVAALSGLFVRLAEPLSHLLKVTPGVVVTGIGVVILVLICVQLSVSISGLQKQVRRLAEDSALASAGQMRTKSSSRVLVVVPAYNEQESVGAVVRDLTGFGHSVLVVDDGSKDGTAEEARGAGACVISMPFNTGVGGALRAGLKFAIMHDFPTVVQCDADGQHPVEFIDELIHAAESRECHMMIGSRFTNGQAEAMHVPRHRRAAMRVLGRSASRAVGTRITDVTSGFRVFRGELVPALAEYMPAYYLGDTFEAVISAGRSGYRVEEFPVPIRERQNGNSSTHSLQAARLTAKAFLTSALHLHVRLPSLV